MLDELVEVIKKEFKYKPHLVMRVIWTCLFLIAMCGFVLAATLGMVTSHASLGGIIAADTAIIFATSVGIAITWNV